MANNNLDVPRELAKLARSTSDVGIQLLKINKLKFNTVIQKQRV